MSDEFLSNAGRSDKRRYYLQSLDEVRVLGKSGTKYETGSWEDEDGNVTNAEEVDDAVALANTDRIAGALQEHAYSDGYIALLTAAVEETGDVAEAIEVANTAWEKVSEDPGVEPQGEDLWEALGVTKAEALEAFGLIELAETAQNAGAWKEFKANAFCATGPGGGVNPHCSPGEHGGKGEEEDADRVVEKRLDKLEEFYEKIDEGNATEVAREAITSGRGLSKELRKAADNEAEDSIQQLDEDLGERVEDVAPRAVKDHEESVHALVDDMRYAVKQVDDSLHELAASYESGAHGDEIWEVSARFQEYLSTARDYAKQYPARADALREQFAEAAREEANEG